MKKMIDISVAGTVIIAIIIWIIKGNIMKGINMRFSRLKKTFVFAVALDKCR